MFLTSSIIAACAAVFVKEDLRRLNMSKSENADTNVEEFLLDPSQEFVKNTAIGNSVSDSTNKA
jgi:hypothetical protein